MEVTLIEHKFKVGEIVVYVRDTFRTVTEDRLRHKGRHFKVRYCLKRAVDGQLNYMVEGIDDHVFKEDELEGQHFFESPLFQALL